MCGICGAYEGGGPATEPVVLKGMCEVIRHRGPDGEGTFASEGVALGHRRLSIIDIEGGGQPITNETGRIWIVFNGEVYNFVELREELLQHGHVFKTRSDTEVVLHAYEQWGLDCLYRFNGMFAFAIWDASQSRLFIARDHLGIKPLYYTVQGKCLIFASEIKSLLQHPLCPHEIDLRSLAQLFSLRYVPSPNTMFAHIKKLPPGHYMTATASGACIKRYWTSKPAFRSEDREESLIEEYRYLVEDAVRLQMRSDVPVGLFLSSGVDSGALLALMSPQSNGPVHTFTIGFEGGEESNETSDARQIANLFGANHTEMTITSRDYVDYYRRYLWDIEEPVGNETAAAFYFVSRIASGKVKVALTGQGADEPWAGYSRYIGARLSEVYSLFPSFVTNEMIAPLVRRLVKKEQIRRGVASLNEPDPLTRLVKIYSFFDVEMKRRLFQPWLQDSISVDGTEAKDALRQLQLEVSDRDMLTQMTYVDTRTNLPDDLLMVGDKTAMANSLEARVPYLDYRLVEFAESLAPHLKIKLFQQKYLHKKALSKWLPRDIVYRKKKGFANPIDRWLRGQMHSFVHDALLASDSAVSKYFDLSYIREMVGQHESGKQHYLRHIYLLISFELWHRAFLPS